MCCNEVHVLSLDLGYDISAAVESHARAHRSWPLDGCPHEPLRTVRQETKASTDLPDSPVGNVHAIDFRQRMRVQFPVQEEQ